MMAITLSLKQTTVTWDLFNIMKNASHLLTTQLIEKVYMTPRIVEKRYREIAVITNALGSHHKGENPMVPVFDE